MASGRRLRCRRHGKQAYASQETAEAALAASRENPRGMKVPVRAYQARCGFWHLTSKELRP